MPATYTVDLEIGKTFDITSNISARLFCEILNVTDQRNILYVYTDTGEPDITYEGDDSPEYINDPSNWGAPRSIRLGLGLQF